MSIKFCQLQGDLPIFDSPVCLSDLSINVYDSFAPRVVGELERNCFQLNTYHVPCTLAHNKMR